MYCLLFLQTVWCFKSNEMTEMIQFLNDCSLCAGVEMLYFKHPLFFFLLFVSCFSIHIFCLYDPFQPFSYGFMFDKTERCLYISSVNCDKFTSHPIFIKLDQINICDFICKVKFEMFSLLALLCFFVFLNFITFLASSANIPLMA